MSTDELAHEQHYVSTLYERVDNLRERTAARLAQTLRERADTPQALSEREAEVARCQQQLARLDAAEPGLCFGRLDLRDGERRYIGRIGLFDEDRDYQPLLIDWRAPAARPFYLATAAAPQDVRRRRHIRTRERLVVGLDDEVLDLSEGVEGSGRESLVNEAALLAAVSAERTGRMADIVATIQAEQDRIIRADHHGVLVVEGGPGTGKTAVALHRAAYLLYTHRRELTTRGVLIVGPNQTFLRYIDQVLPSLGETAVLLRTIGDLYPGVSADRVEPAEVSALKGSAVMAEVLAAAVRDRQEVPSEVREVVTTDAHPGLGYQPEVLRLHPAACRRARDRARASGLPHNRAQRVFAEVLVDTLARQVADRLGEDPYADVELPGGGGFAGFTPDPEVSPNLLGEGDVARIAEELASDPQVRAAIAQLWPILSPQQLLSDLFASEERLAAAAPGLSAEQRASLRREPGGGWSVADVPLLDEAAELLGEPGDPGEGRRADQEERERLEYALGVLEIAYGSRSIDVEDEAEPDILAAHDLLDASGLARRQEVRDHRPVAERAAADRTWLFGHVIVDEAQELSPMAWRALMRRCPARSMTIVGDVAQTGDLAGITSWREALEPYAPGRWRRERLSVNYRTPAEVMEVAAPVLAAIDPLADAPRSVRESGERPWRVRVAADELAGEVARLVAQEVAALEQGRLAVVAPARWLEALGEALPGASVGGGADLEQPVVVLSVRQAKGLEFDTVLVVEPEEIVAGSPRGLGDLYVALTRATRRLGVVHTGVLPSVLGGLREREVVSAG